MTVISGADAVYLKAGRVIALDCVNMVKDYVQGRSWSKPRSFPTWTDSPMPTCR